ncbi:hypothetical protein ABT126_39955 [Streptomyces sp. NPDC002012]|uniref:hypothetical protein n=1 Tax=Streptomyces sp. NPDC002012 TaxID=3154532 RepID=UPI00331EE4BB
MTPREGCLRMGAGAVFGSQARYFSTQVIGTVPTVPDGLGVSSPGGGEDLRALANSGGDLRVVRSGSQPSSMKGWSVMG